MTEQLLADGLLERGRAGASRYQYLLGRQADLAAYLDNHFGIKDLDADIGATGEEGLVRLPGYLHRYRRALEQEALIGRR